VHCAYDFGPRDWPTIERVNVHGTRALFGAARAAGVQRLVFISSLSAHAGCRSLYGRAKLHCEDVAKEFDAVILRPGLVVGSPPGGMAGSLRRVLASPVVPVVGGSAMLYTVRASELAHATAQAALTSHIPAGMPIAAAHESPLTLLSLLRGFAEAEGRSPLFIALPSWPVLVGLRALETAGFGLGFRSDSLLGLLHGDPAPPFHATREAGLVFSPLGAEDTLRTGSGAPR
jgi:NADH dehydrogenase